jgi:type II secretory pathway component PulF
MATFTYEAYDASGAIVHGQIEASGKGEVVEQLLRKSLKPLSVSPLSGSSSRFQMQLIQRLAAIDVLFLVRNLATTLKAGMSVTESLDMLIDDTDRPYLKSVLQQVQAKVKNGEQLSKGFDAFRDQFPPAFIGMLRAGEVSGQLDATLTSLGSYLVKEYQLRQQVKSALIYPIVLLCASVAIIALLLIVVLPRLTASFAQSGIKLPLITKVFLGLSNALTYSITLDLAFVVFIAWFFLYFRRRPLGKRIWFALLWHVPVAKHVITKVALVRFTRTFGNLVSSGIAAVEALEITADSLGNAVYAGALKEAARDIERGVSLSSSLHKHTDLFPKVLIGLITVGERTGQLSPILLSLADFYEDEVGTRLKNLTAILEPLLLLVMGLVVGAIALSILLPIYQLVGNVG